MTKERENKKTKAAPDSGEARPGVIALSRGLEILQCFTPTRPRLGSAEIARLTGLPQPTVWRLCQTLVQQGFLLPTPGQRLQLGTAALSLGIAASASFNALEIVRPRMQALADRYRSAISIAGHDRLYMVYLERCTAEVMVGTNLQRGSRLPLHKCTLGWAYLAVLDEKERSAILARLRKAFPEDAGTIDELAISKLRQYQRTGYVLHRGLVHREIIALAVPIPAPAGMQPLAINCSSDSANLSARQLETEVEPQLREMAEILRTMFVQEDPPSVNGWFDR